MDEWDRERWRGEVDSEIRSIKVTLVEMKLLIKEGRDELSDLKLIVKGLSTRMAGYGALGAFLGGGIMSVIVGLFMKH